MTTQRNSEMGSARLKFILVMAVVLGGAYAGYMYIPVAFQAYKYKDMMQHYVDVAGSQGYQPTWAADQLRKSAAEYEVPPNAIITPTNRDSRVEVRVQFTRPIEFLGYTYDYEFDHTVKSTAFIVIK